MSNFTFDHYCELLRALQHAKLNPYTVGDFIAKQPETDYIILRHDVERSTPPTLEMARREHEMGLCSTYYFRMIPGVFVPEDILRVAEMGHEVGLHYETLDMCAGNYLAAEDLFAKQLEKLRGLGVTVNTVCMHGNPRIKKVTYEKNSDLWKGRVEEMNEKFGLLGEAYLSIDFDPLEYISDVGIRWSNICYHTKGLAQAVHTGEYRRMYMLAHPDYWSKSVFKASALYWAGKTMRTTKINKLVAEVRSWMRRGD